MNLLKLLELRNDDFSTNLSTPILMPTIMSPYRIRSTFLKVTQLIFDDSKFIEIWFRLTLDYIVNILKVTNLVTLWIAMLEQLDFVHYYVRVLDIIRRFFIDNNDL